MGFGRWFVIILAFLLSLPAVSAHYYVILDENLSYLGPYASEIAKLHNGSLVVSNFSNLGFLGANDYALFIVGRPRFTEGFVYSVYNRLDFDGDGIYDPVLGFLPVWGTDDLVRFWWALADFQPARAAFVQYGEVDWEGFQRLSQNSSLIWLEGHGSPEGISMGSWGLYPSNLGDVAGKAFVLESCDVGRIWESEDPLVMALLRAGSPAVVASIDMGGVSYLPKTLWASGYPLGKLVQISNAYFMKVGVPPKAVLFGDPAVVPVNSSGRNLVVSPAVGIYARIFTRVNGYIYTPGEPGLGAMIRAYGNLFSVMDLWRGVFTIKGVGSLLILVSLFVFLLLRPEGRDLLLSCLSAVASFLILGVLMGYPSLGTSLSIVMFWTVTGLFVGKRAGVGLMLLFLPPATITLTAVLFGMATLRYGFFLVIISLTSSLIVFALLTLFKGVFGRIISP